MIEETIKQAIDEGLTLQIHYMKPDGTTSVREISDISYSDEYGKSHISAFCHTRQENRTFKISRISKASIVPSKAQKIFDAPTPYVFNKNKKIFNLYGEIYD